MKAHFYFLLFILSLVQLTNAQSNYDQIIKQVHSNMSVDSVKRFITEMQNFGSRFEYNENRFTIANWLKNQFLTMGFTDVVLDSFMCTTSWNGNIPVVQVNVIATLPGSERPDIYITGGHYDSYNETVDPLGYAPGADDNASGITATLETARAIMKSGYKPKATIKFICFAAEELMISGDSGSEYLADKYHSENKKIKLMINNDMISYTSLPVSESLVSINYYPGYEYFIEQVKELTHTYTSVNAVTGTSNQWSDSKPFYNKNYPAIYFEENQFSPLYHTSGDVITNYNMDYCLEIIKASSALLISNCEMPSPVTSFLATDYGNGSSVLLTWDKYVNNNYELVNNNYRYNIYSGPDQKSMELLTSVQDTTYMVTGLHQNSVYYFGISVVDNNGNEGRKVILSCVPNKIPLPPAGLMVTPKWHSIELVWAQNREYDLNGYNIYRTNLNDSLEIKINNAQLTDTILVDLDVQNVTFYSYRVSAVDKEGNESSKSAGIHSRAVSLDQGVLFVDETNGRDGSIGNPSTQQLDDFYLSLIDSGIKFENYNMSLNGGLDLSVIGAYNTILWHLDSKTNNTTFSYIKYLTDFLKYGGRIIYSGFKPSAAFTGVTATDREYETGSFIFDFMKISKAENSFGARLNSAISSFAGYPTMEIDTNKTNSISNYHLTQIESIAANDAGNSIYLWGSGYDQSTPQGNYNGKPIGVEYLGADHQSVVLSAPLYYFKKDQAKTFLNYVLKDRFNVPTDVNNHEAIVIKDFKLLQNYPNPFNPTTVINYQLSVYSKVQLKIYDVLGREIRQLVNEYKNPGVYQVEFNGSEFSNGVYFYALQAGEYSSVKKMLLLK